MTHKAKDLSPDQKMAIESLLGRSIAENEEISIRTTTSPTTPEWLQASWKSAKEQGLDQLSAGVGSREEADFARSRCKVLTYAFSENARQKGACRPSQLVQSQIEYSLPHCREGIQSMSQRMSVTLLLILTATVALIFLLLPRIPQPQAYHLFADRRSLLGTPNFGDVASNVPFAVIGIWGLIFLLRSDSNEDTGRFLEPGERWPYLFVFVGLLLTAFGSSYYHLSPNNSRLVWDRLPMTIAFMSMVAAIIAERISLQVGLWLLPMLVLVGMGSVWQWYASEMRGSGDLRLYAAVQVYSALVLLLALFLPQRYTRGSDLAIVVGFYALAKVLEALDIPIFAAGHIVSGHTLKHLAAAAAGYFILRMLQKRRPLVPLPSTAPTVAPANLS